MYFTFRNSKNAFSLIELVVSIAVLGVLAAMSTQVFMEYKGQIYEQRAFIQLKQVETSIIAFFSDGKDMSFASKTSTISPNGSVIGTTAGRYGDASTNSSFSVFDLPGYSHDKDAGIWLWMVIRGNNDTGFPWQKGSFDISVASCKGTTYGSTSGQPNRKEIRYWNAPMLGGGTQSWHAPRYRPFSCG